MAFDYINEAFKRLDALDENMFSSSFDGINKLKEFVDEDDTTEETVRVIDPTAEDSEAIEDSYVGKVIINCNVCHSHIFENKEDVTIDEDGAVNVEMQCPYCGETEGFVIIGEIAPYGESSSAENSDDASNDTEDESGTPEAAELENKDFNESFSEQFSMSRATRRNRLKEAVEEGTSVELTCDFYKNAKDLMRIHVKGSSMSDALINLLKTENFGVSSAEISKLSNASEKDILDAIGKHYADGTNVIAKIYDNKDVYYKKDLPKYITDPEFNKALTLSEDFKEVSIKTEDQKLEMSSDENGKVTVTTEPISNELSSDTGDTIVPISAETESEILNNNDVEEASEEEVDEESADASVEDEATVEDEETSEEDVSFDEADEESIDDLGESYFKRVYENVDTFKTTSISSTPKHLVVEGIIKFNSGAQKKTGFVFEARDINSRGQVRFVGTNKHLTEDANAFCLVGRVDNKKLVVESLKYNYSVSNNVVRGLIRRK